MTTKKPQTKTFKKNQTFFIHRGDNQYLALDVNKGTTIELEGSIRTVTAPNGQEFQIILTTKSFKKLEEAIAMFAELDMVTPMPAGVFELQNSKGKGTGKLVQIKGTDSTLIEPDKRAPYYSMCDGDVTLSNVSYGGSKLDALTLAGGVTGKVKSEAENRAYWAMKTDDNRVAELEKSLLAAREKAEKSKEFYRGKGWKK